MNSNGDDSSVADTELSPSESMNNVSQDVHRKEKDREIKDDVKDDVRIDIKDNIQKKRKAFTSTNSKSIIEMISPNLKKKSGKYKRKSHKIVTDILSRSNNPSYSDTSIIDSSDDSSDTCIIPKKNIWSDETVKQLIEFSDICNYSALQCKRSAIKHRRIGQTIEIIVILLGSLSAMLSSWTFENVNTRLLINTVSGISIALLTGIQGFLKFLPRSEIELHSWLELEKIARCIKIELAKSVELRTDPYKLILRLEKQREKIIQHVGIEEEN